MSALALDAPPDQLLDEALRLVVRGARPGREVELTARLVDGRGTAWTSAVRLRAGADGTAPLVGDDARRPLWSMCPDDDAGPFVWGSLAPLTLELEAGELPGGPRARARVRLAVAPDDVAHERVDQDGVRGELVRPPGPAAPGVVLLSGSEGGTRSQLTTAGLLAARGFACLVVAWLGPDAGRDALELVPLETFTRAAELLRSLPGVADAPVALLGASKGAEGALLAAAHAGTVGPVVAFSGSPVAFSGLRDVRRPVSSWTWRGEPVPFLRLRAWRLAPAFAAAEAARARGARPRPIRLRAAYAAALPRRLARHPAAGPLGRLRAPVLLLTGTDDAVWPATRLGELAEGLVARRAGAPPLTHVAYRGAGHQLGPPNLPTTVPWWTDGPRFALGGDPEATAAARVDAWRRVVAFLGAPRTERAGPQLAARWSPPRRGPVYARPSCPAGPS